MSRRGDPRRFLAILVIGLAPIVAAGAAAYAQPRRQDAVARTTIGSGGPLAECNAAAGAGTVTDAGLAACTRAIERGRLARPDLATTHVNRGVLHLRRRAGEAALADFDAALAINAEFAEAHLNRGAALVLLHQPGPAVAAITQALGFGVREPHKAYFNRGAAREALGDLRGAYEDYSTALEIEPNWDPAEAELQRFVRARREHLAQVIGVNDPGAQAQP